MKRLPMDPQSRDREAQRKKKIIQRRDRRKRTLIWLFLVFVACAIITAAIVFVPDLIKRYIFVDDYLPRDIERKYYELKERQAEGTLPSK